jgi:hypothetical protein
MLRPEDLECHQALVPSDGASGLAVNINPRRKREVAEGLLQNSDLHGGHPNGLPDRMPATSPQELREAFLRRVPSFS